jgi:hypothetical protein
MEEKHHGNKEKECCDEKGDKHHKHGDKCDEEGFAFDCNLSFKSKDSGAFVKWTDIETSVKEYNNNQPISSPTRNLGGQIHSSLVQAAVQSMGPEGGYMYYYFGIRHNGAAKDTVMYLIGGNKNPNCPNKYYNITALSYCPDRCPKGQTGQ